VVGATSSEGFVVSYHFAACYVQTPGPGHYGLPHVNTYKTRAPGCPIIGRKSQSIGSVGTPGPADHCPGMVGFSLCFLLTFIFAV